MDFARGQRLAPYLAKLGVSHLYMSPILRAVPTSPHGYDGARYDEIEPLPGGERSNAKACGSSPISCRTIWAQAPLIRGGATF